MLHRKKEMVMLFSAYEILQRKKKKGHRPASHFAPIVLKAGAHNEKMANLSKSMDELLYLKQLNK